MKTAKRVLSLLLCFVLAWSALSVSAFAIDASPVEFTVTSVKGVQNKDVHVEVRVSDNSGIGSLGIELLFDSSKLLVKDFAEGDAFANGMSAINGNISDKVIASYASLEPITDAGTLFSVDFLVTSADINEELGLELNVTEISDVNGTPLSTKNQPGVVQVVDLLYGDLNADNRITAVDALKILSASTELITLTEAEEKAADVNGNGEVNVSDALQVLYYSAEIINDFTIYHLAAPLNLEVTNLDGYQFTVEWDFAKDVIGYNVYLDGEQVNSEMLTDTSVTIGVSSSGDMGDALIPRRIHDKIEQVTTYNVQITAVNALKESEKSGIDVTTKRVWSWVTFKDWDGREIRKVRVYYGDDAPVPNDPTREHYFFTGWDKDTTNIIDDTVITATYEDAHYDFIFRDEDGTELYRQDVTYGGSATPPASPTKKGYTFSGWYTGATGGTLIEDFTITDSVRTAYAHYTINIYRITFDSTGGSSVGSVQTEYMTGITKPADPTRLGYGFGGWYKEASCSNAWNFATDVVTENTTLYAKWNPVVITIDKSNVTLNSIGSTAQLNATITGGTDSLTWSSSNTAVATVSATGLITAKGHGTATIYVKGVSSERRPVTKVTVNIAKDAWVTHDNVNIRAQATTASGVLGQVNAGNKITVYGDMVAQGVSGQTGWYNIKAPNGTVGYISANYVSFTEVKPNVGQLTGTFAERVQQLRSQLPNGWYWNHLVSNSAPGGDTLRAQWNESCVGVTQTPCATHDGSVGNGKYDCNFFDGGIQCCGFARYVHYKVKNTKCSSHKIYTKNFDDIRAGDVLGINPYQDQYGNWIPGHYVFVIEKQANYIVIVEANVHYHNGSYKYWPYTRDGCPCCNCRIRWDQQMYRGSFVLHQIERA